MAKYLDMEGLTYFLGKLNERFQRQETGKGLSTNDYTTPEKTKLANLPDTEVITPAEIDELFSEAESAGEGAGEATDSNA